MNKEKNFQKELWVILIIVFLGFVGISIPYLIFPPLFLNEGYTFLPTEWNQSTRALLLGITLAAYPLGQFVGSPILGALSDEFGRKKVLTISLLITGICNLFTGVALERHSLWLLLVSRLVAGLMEGNIAIARAMAADFKTRSKHETFGKIEAAGSVAYLIGPLLGGLMADQTVFPLFRTSTPFFFICALFIVLVFIACLILKKSPPIAPYKIQTIGERLHFLKKIKSLLSNKPVKVLLITSTCFTLAVDIFYEFGPVYLTVKWALMPAGLIFYNGILCVGLAIGNGWLPVFLSSRISHKLSMFLCMGGFALFLAAISFTNTAAFMLFWFALSGLVIGAATILITVKISDSVSDKVQGEVMGVQVSMRVLGDAIICLCGGVLLIFSAKLILILAAFVSIGAIIYYQVKNRLA